MKDNVIAGLAIFLIVMGGFTGLSVGILEQVAHRNEAKPKSTVTQLTKQLKATTKTCSSSSENSIVRSLSCTFNEPVMPGESVVCSVFPSPLLSDSGVNSWHHDPNFYAEHINTAMATVTVIFPEPSYLEMQCNVVIESN